MPTLYLSLGLPFSGKSKLSREICQRTGAELVSSDKLFEQHHLEWDKRGVSHANQWVRAIELGIAAVEDLLKQGRSVVFDNGNYLRSQRSRLRRIALESEAETLVVWLDASLDVIRVRMARNDKIAERPDASQDTLTRHIKLLERPINDEIYIRLGSEPEIENWLQTLT